MCCCVCVAVCYYCAYYCVILFYEDDSQVLDFFDDVTTETMSIMKMWREHFIPVAEELLYNNTS